MSDDDDYWLGTPVAAGSDNWKPQDPPCCEHPVFPAQLTVSNSGFSLRDGKLLGRSAYICVYSGTRFTLTNNTSANLYFKTTALIFGRSSVTLTRGQTLSISMARVSVATSGSIWAPEDPGGPLAMDVTVCSRSEIDENPF